MQILGQIVLGQLLVHIFLFFFFFFFSLSGQFYMYMGSFRFENNNNVRYACWCKREADYVQWLVQSLDVDIWTSVCWSCFTSHVSGIWWQVSRKETIRWLYNTTILWLKPSYHQPRVYLSTMKASHRKYYKLYLFSVRFQVRWLNESYWKMQHCQQLFLSFVAIIVCKCLLVSL